MKDGLNETAIHRLSRGLRDAGADFSEASFYRDAIVDLDSLELRQRVDHLIDVMSYHLPDNFTDVALILSKVREHWDHGDPADKLSAFAAWPVVDYVAARGIQHPELSLSLLRYLTPLYSAEFAIRPFLFRYPEKTYNEMMLWCLDSDEHVRRLASEGIRPRLPWGSQLKQYIRDPLPVVALLETLIDDPSDYVRRSVGNNLNDISKDHPDLVIETCQRWMSDKVIARQWIIQRATRTLVKDGNPKVFPLLGYTKHPKLEVSALKLTPELINMGESLQICVDLISNSEHPQRLVIDYAIHFMKANGKTSAKVFKWKNLNIQPEERVSLTKHHTIKVITTRAYYSGAHKVELLINGKNRAEAPFELYISKP